MSSIMLMRLQELCKSCRASCYFISFFYYKWADSYKNLVKLKPKNTGYNLRQRTHDLTLPTDINAVTKQNFVYRMLFRDIY